jgi:hypothetical protein
MKTCIKCGEQKPLSEFNIRSDTKKPLGSCKTCVKTYSKTQHLKNLSKRKDQKLKKSYGISLLEKHAMLKNQNNKCGICKKELTTERDKNVDHCHATGLVRSILCCKCNFGIGYFDDSVQYLENAVQYIKHHAKKDPV